MRKRNNQDESKTMMCRHFTSSSTTSTNRNKQSSSTLVPSKQAAAESSKHPRHHHRQTQHEPWSFPVGRNVHDRSWGKRVTTKMAGTKIPNRTHTPGNGFRQSEPWTAADFSILQNLGEGHFGCVFQAKFTNDESVFTRSSSSSTSMSMGRDQHADQDVRDDMDDSDSDCNNGSIRDDNDDDTRDSKDRSTGGTSSAFPKYVALKRFCKSRIRQSQQRGNRALELLHREVNIHSQ
jgi:hypothetical protein